MLRNISGTYVQSGSLVDRSLSSTCPSPVSYGTKCTPPRMVANRGGTMSVSARPKGVLRLAKLRLALELPRALSACEPRGVAAASTRVELAIARANARDVFDSRARAVELETGATETTTFSGGDTGRATVDVSWTVSFEPVGP
jgi:hypothetical protein